jgi:hypothetical protein
VEAPADEVEEEEPAEDAEEEEEEEEEDEEEPEDVSLRAAMYGGAEHFGHCKTGTSEHSRRS